MNLAILTHPLFVKINFVKSTFYDYSAKYIDDKSKLEIPAKLPKDLISRIRESAVKAYMALDGAGLARVDFFVEKETNVSGIKLNGGVQKDKKCGGCC